MKFCNSAIPASDDRRSYLLLSASRTQASFIIGPMAKMASAFAVLAMRLDAFALCPTKLLASHRSLWGLIPSRPLVLKLHPFFPASYFYSEIPRHETILPLSPHLVSAAVTATQMLASLVWSDL